MDNILRLFGFLLLLVFYLYSVYWIIRKYLFKKSLIFSIVFTLLIIPITVWNDDRFFMFVLIPLEIIVLITILSSKYLFKKNLTYSVVFAFSIYLFIGASIYITEELSTPKLTFSDGSSISTPPKYILGYIVEWPEKILNESVVIH